MPFPDDYNARLHDRYEGTDDVSQRVSDRADAIIAANKRIAAILTECRDKLKAEGEPEYFATASWDFDDIVEIIGEATPAMDADDERRIEEYASEQEGQF